MKVKSVTEHLEEINNPMAEPQQTVEPITRNEGETKASFIERSGAQTNAQRLERRDDYVIPLQDWEYDEIEKLTGMADKHDIAGAWKLSKELDIPLQQAWENLDAYKYSLYGEDAYKVKPESAWKAIVDSFNMGKNTLNMGERGLELMRAELNGDEEYAKSIMDYYNALEEENMLLSQTAERDGWLGETIAKYGAQSAPFTLASVGLAYIPVMGPALSFAFSASNMAGLEYIDARKHGASKESALGVSAVVGTVNGIVELALGRVAGAIGAQVIDKAKKPAAELLRRGVTDKIAEKVMKSLHLSGHWRALAQTLTRAMEENLEEGLEEVLQETVSLAGKKALRYANEEYDVPEMSWEEVGQDLYENFKGGFLGSILLGMPNAAMNAYSNYKDVNAVKTAAETVTSREAFGNTVKSIEEDAKKNGRPGIFNENLSEKEKAEYLDKLWKSKADRREETFRKQEADIAEAYSAEDIMEAVETEEDQEGEVISEEIPEVYRDKDGKLYTENQSTGENKGRFAAGNPEGGKNYGYIDYTIDEEAGTVTIDNFKMASHREAVRNDLFIDFARDFSGYEIKWDPKGKLLNDVKSTLIEINPQGKEKGLSFFGSIDEKLSDDATTKLNVARELAEKTSLTPAQQKAFIALLDVSGKNLGGNITEFVNNNFAGSIIADKSQKAKVENNLKNMIKDQLGFLTSGMTEEKAKELNLREDQVEVINNALKGVDQDTRQALAEYALYAGKKSEGIDRETFAKAKAAIDANPELKKVMAKAVSIAGQEAKGAAITVDDFRSVIYAGENADFSTFAHELAHIWRKNLTGDLLAEAEKAFGVKDGKWTRADEENFARDFEQYLYTGKAKNSALRDIFQQLAQFLKNVYQSLRNLEAQGGIKLTDDIVNVFDRILADENSGLNQKAEAKAEEKVQENTEAKTEEKTEPAAQEEKKTSFDEVTEEAVNDIVDDPTLSEEEKNNAALNASGADVVDSLIDFFEKAAQEEIITEDEAKLNGFSMDDNGNYYEMLFMLIGPEGASRLDKIYDGDVNGRRTAARRNAEKMEIDGRSVEEIARATGWKKNNDLNGTWWTEIADGEFKNYNALVDKLSRIMTLGKAAKSITDPQQMERHNMDMASLLKKVTGLKLKDVFDAKDLYKIYPELAEREVNFTMLPVPYNATIGPEGISLNLYYTADLNKLRTGLIETLQRLLQGIELDKDGGKKFYIESQQKWQDFAKFMSQSYGEDWQMHTYAANLRAISQFLNSYEYLKYHTGPRQEQVQTVSKRANMNELERSNTLYQLIGYEGAAALDEAEDKTERIDNLNIAQEMEADGKDAKTIRLATGWEKGADKKWKYEIDDGEFVKEGFANMPEYEEWKKSTTKEKEFAAQNDFKGMGKQHSESVKLYKAMQEKEEGLVYKKLDAIYKNDELYDAYPQLRKILVYQWGKGPQEGERGHYTSGDETITLYTDNRTEEELKSTLLHEIQHAIQEIEGFAKGGSVESVIANQYNSLIDDIAPIYATIGSNDALNSKIKEYVKASNELDFNSDDIVEKINEVEAIKNNDETMLSLWDKLQDISRKYDLIYKPETAPLFDFRATDIQSPTATEALRAAKNVFETRAYSTYRGLAGEVESRNVQARMNFTTEQRRNQLLEDTEDVERKEQIVLFQTDEDGLKNSIEIDDRSLVGLHNLSEDALRHTVKMGGLANPSMAVIDTNKQGFTNFGGVTLIAPKTLIAKDTGRNAGTFGADVYSPRYPSITRQVTSNGRKKLKSIFWAIEDENLKESLVENTVQKFENDRKPDFEYTKLPIAYLAEKGNKDFWKYKKTKYDDSVKEAFKALKSDSVEDPETAKFLKDLFDKEMKGAYEEEVKDYEEMLKDDTLTVFKRNIYTENMEKAKARLALGESVIEENTDPNTGYLYFAPAENLRYEIEKDIRDGNKVDEYPTERAARELVENDPDFKKWAEEKYASVEADEKIFDGFTPSGNRKYLKHTLENVSKYMKKEGVRGGESFSYGMGSTRARVTPKWSTLKDIAKNKSRLVSKEDFEKIKNELDPIYDKYVEICDNGDGFDVGEARLNEALETKNPITYLKNEYDIEIADKDEFNKFVRDLKAMPTEYFETKFTRPVYLNEFYGAVIPKKASAETRKTLEDAGLIVKEYEEGSDRLAAIKEIGRAANGLVMFQTAYHGTSTDFNEFDLDYGFSGEGSMSFGYGVYLTNDKSIAENYAVRQAEQKSLKKFAEDMLAHIESGERTFEEEKQFAIERYRKYVENGIPKVVELSKPKLEFAENVNSIEDLKKAIDQTGRRYVYTVDIPEGKYIKWDETLNKEEIDNIARQLPLFMRNVLKNGEFGNEYTAAQLEEFSNDYERRLKRAYELDPQLNGGDLYYRLWFYYIKPHVGENEIMAQKLASGFLNSMGYIGIDYPAGTHYGNGNNARNYVIFNEKDARIVDHIKFQTETDLKNLAQQFDNWQDFMEYFESPFIDEGMAAMVPQDATTSWYQNYWETVNNITPTTEEMQEQKEAEYFNNDREDKDPVTADAIFLAEIRSAGRLEAFLKQIDEVMKIDADDWANDALDDQDREDAENIRKVQQQIRALHNQAFVRNSLRVAGGKPLSDKMRKNILTAIRNATRSYRAIYATVMSDSRFAVDEKAEEAAINELAERGKKAGLEKDPTLMSPTERIKYAEDIREKEIAEQIRTGKFKYDEEAEFYIKRQQKALNQAGKEFKEYKAKVDADFNELGDVMQRDLMKLYGKLLEVKNELEYKKMNVPSKLEANIKAIGKYNRDLSALQDNYSTLYTKYKDAEKAIELNAEFRQKLDHMETYQKAKSEYKQLRKEQKAIDELKEIRKKLVKRTMRSVDFKNVEYEHAKALIALQRIFDPNMRQGINKWIGIESVTAREIWSDYKTDEEERKRIINILMKTPTGSELVRKLDNAKTERDFDMISDKDKKSLERRLANSDWIKSLQLDRLKYGREQAIQLDITEVERKLPTGEIDQYGNEKYTNEWVAEYSDEIARLLEEFFPDDLITKVQAKPFQYWTIGEMEDLAKTFQDVYTAGRDALNAKRIREQTDAYRIRELIAKQVRDTGIVINEDDPEDVKKKKEEKIAKILGTSNAVKGLFDEKESRFMNKINSILHGYHDANIRRVARILDGYSEGTCTEMLYWKENECYTRQENSKNRRFQKVASVMEENGIDVTELYRQVAINYRGEIKTLSVDKLLFIAQAVANNEAYQKEQEKAGIPQRLRDEESGYQAVVYGNLMTVDEKKPLIEMDQKLKEEEEKRKADLILATQLGDEESIRELQKVSLETHDENGNLKLPGRDQIKATCKERLEEFMKEYEKLDPKFKKLQEAIAEDYSQEFERINRASVEEFNMPVWREKWYLPLIRKGATGDTHEARVRADLLGAVAGTGKAGTEKGFTQKRVRIAPEHQTPVELGLYSTWADSVERNEHFINYASYVRELNRLFANKDAQPLMQEIQNRYGSGMKRYIDSYIKEVANPNAGEPVKDFDKVIRLLRGSTAPAYLGFKASSVLKQALSSPAPFMQFVNPIEYTKAAIRCIKPEVQEAIQAKSVFMRNRVFDPIVDVVNEQKNNASNPLVYRAKEVLAKGMQPLEWIDWACVAPGWLAVYEKERAALLAKSEAMVAARLAELKELNDSGLMGERRSMRDLEAQARAETDEDIETMAVNKADDATRLCQPSNRKVDLAPMFKNGSELQKAVLQFQTALNVIWQNIRYDLPYAVRTKQYKQIVGMTMGYVMAGIAMGLLADGLGDDDEDEAQKVRNFVWYSTTQFTDSMPVVGSMITATAEKIITGKAGYQTSNDIFPTFTKFKEGTFALTDENYRKAAAKFAEGTALTLGLPTSGAKEAARAFGIGDGDGQVEFYPEAFLGRRKED